MRTRSATRTSRSPASSALGRCVTAATAHPGHYPSRASTSGSTGHTCRFVLICCTLCSRAGHHGAQECGERTAASRDGADEVRWHASDAFIIECAINEHEHLHEPACVHLQLRGALKMRTSVHACIPPLRHARLTRRKASAQSLGFTPAYSVR